MAEDSKKEQQRKEGADRGREADRPRQIPRRGWRDILLRVMDEQSDDNLMLISAGVAFYGFLSLFPAIATAISIYGLVASPGQLEQQVGSLSGILPQEVYAIIRDQLAKIVQSAESSLSWAVALGVLLTLWSASGAMKGLIQALNIAYDEEERRSFLKLNALGLLLTLAALVFFIIALTLIVALSAALGRLGLPESWEIGISLARWVLLSAMTMLGLSLLYRYVPCRNRPKWRWVTWGSAVATVLWLTASILFSWYVSNLGSYNETYGSLGAVVILLMWFFLSAFVVLLGAELNAEMEHQTRRDSTEGEPKPMGSRGAYVADHLGRQP